MALSLRRLVSWATIVVVLAIEPTSCALPQLTGEDYSGTAPEEVVAVESAVRAALLAAADHYLENKSENSMNVLAAVRPELNPRMFCHEEFIEVRREDPPQLLGIVVWCQELARSGNVLIEGSGFIAPILLTMQSVDGRFSVAAEKAADDGERNLPSIREMFSLEGAPRAFELVSGGGRATMEGLLDEGRRAFGLPPDAPATFDF